MNPAKAALSAPVKKAAREDPQILPGGLLILFFFFYLRHGICVAKMLDNVGLRYPHRASGQKPLALCDRCPCFGSLHPPLAALTFAASSIICAFGLASAPPRSPYRHLELCGIALIL